MQSFYIKNSFNFCGYKISNNSRAIIIAEISANHNGSLKRAKDLIKEAKRSGADLIKIQTYTGNSLAINCKKKDFKIPKKSPWHKHGNLWNLYEHAKTPFSWHKELFRYSLKIGIPIFSSPFDEESVDFLESLNCPAYKIASPEVNHIPLIEKIAKTRKPAVVSLGLAYEKDIINIIKIFEKYKSKKLIFLHCVSNYPAHDKDQNLNTINLIKKFGFPVGLSDHSLGIEAPIATVALGGKMVEKHFNLNDRIKTPDSFFSLQPKDFKIMIKLVRKIEEQLGTEKLSIHLNKLNKHKRRSIYIAENLKKGEKFTNKNIRIVRPSLSLQPVFKKNILGKISKKNYLKGDRIYIKDIK